MKKNVCKRLVSAACALTMCLSFAPAVYNGGGYVSAEKAADFDLAEFNDNTAQPAANASARHLLASFPSLLPCQLVDTIILDVA